MSSLSRSRSLKTQRKTVLQKKRPNTWTCHTKRLSIRHTISPRVSKWSQRMSTKSSNDATFQFFHQRQTTISTLTAHSDTVKPFLTPQNNIFHVQSVLFLFGFLWFPCWWVAAYWFKIEPDKLNREEKQVVMIHPSLLANGKTCSRSFWVVPPEQEKVGSVELFYRWNKIMSLVSVGLVVCIVCLMVWYYIDYY